MAEPVYQFTAPNGVVYRIGGAPDEDAARLRARQYFRDEFPEQFAEWERSQPPAGFLAGVGRSFRSALGGQVAGAGLQLEERGLPGGETLRGAGEAITGQAAPGERLLEAGTVLDDLRQRPIATALTGLGQAVGSVAGSIAAPLAIAGGAAALGASAPVVAGAGLAAGIASGAFGGTGELYQMLVAEGVAPERARTLAANVGAAIGAAEGGAAVPIARQILGTAVRRETAERLAEVAARSATGAGLREAGRGAVIEGGSEAAGGAARQAIVAAETGNVDLARRAGEVAFEGVLGAVGGAGVAGAGGTRAPARARAEIEARLTPEERAARQAAAEQPPEAEAAPPEPPPGPVLPDAPLPVESADQANEIIAARGLRLPEGIDDTGRIAAANIALNNEYRAEVDRIRNNELDTFLGRSQLQPAAEGAPQDLAPAADALTRNVLTAIGEGRLSEPRFTSRQITDLALENLGDAGPVPVRTRTQVKKYLDALQKAGYLQSAGKIGKDVAYTLPLRQAEAVAAAAAPAPVAPPAVNVEPEVPAAPPVAQAITLTDLATNPQSASQFLNRAFAQNPGAINSVQSLQAAARNEGLVLPSDLATGLFAQAKQSGILSPTNLYVPPAKRAQRQQAPAAAAATQALNQIAQTGTPATISPQAAQQTAAAQQASEDLQQAVRATPAPTLPRELQRLQNYLPDVVTVTANYRGQQYTLRGTSRRPVDIEPAPPSAPTPAAIPQPTPQAPSVEPPPSLAGVQTGGAPARTEAEQAEARQAFERVVGPRGRLTFEQTLFLQDLGAEVQAAAQAAGITGPIAGYASGDLAVLSLADSTMPLNQVAIHEGWHVAENIGIIKANDIAILNASRGTILNRIRNDLDFVADPDSLSNDEVRAYGANARVSRGTDFGGTVNAIYDRLANFVDRLRNFVAGRGFNSWRDVYDNFLSGRTASLSMPGEPTTGSTVNFASPVESDLPTGFQLRDVTQKSIVRRADGTVVDVSVPEFVVVGQFGMSVARGSNPQEAIANFKEFQRRQEIAQRAPEDARNTFPVSETATRGASVSGFFTSISDVERALANGTLSTKRERESKCYGYAGNAAAELGNDFVIGTVSNGSGNRLSHAVMRDSAGRIYDPQFDAWFDANVYSEAVGNFEPNVVMTGAQVDAFRRRTGKYPSPTTLKENKDSPINFAAPRPVSTPQQMQQATQQYFENQIRGPAKWFSSLDLSIAKDRPALRPAADNMQTFRLSRNEANADLEPRLEKLARLSPESSRKVMRVWQTASMTETAPNVSTLNAEERAALTDAMAGIQRAFDWLIEGYVSDYYMPNAKMPAAEQARLNAFWQRNSGKHLWEIPARELQAASPKGYQEYQRLNRMRNPYKLPAVADGSHFVAVYKRNAAGQREGKPVAMIAYTPRGAWQKLMRVPDPEVIARNELQRLYPNTTTHVVMQRGQQFTQGAEAGGIRSVGDAVTQFLSGLTSLPQFANSAGARNKLQSLLDTLNKQQMDRVFRRSDDVLLAVNDLTDTSYGLDALPRYLLGISNIQARRRTQNDWAEAIKPLTPDDKKYLNDLRDYASTPTESFAGIRSLTFFSLLGFAPDSMAINMLQTIQATMPMLLRDGGVGALRHFGRAYKELTQATGQATKSLLSSNRQNPVDIMTNILRDPQELADYKKALNVGTLLPLYLNESRGQVSVAAMRRLGFRNPEQRAKNFNNVLRFGGGMQAFAEQTNRAVSFLAAYRAAKADPQIIANKNRTDNLQLQTPYDYATSIVNDTHFVTDKSDRALYQRFTPAAEVGTQFMSFVTKTIELYVRQAKLLYRGIAQSDIHLARAGAVGFIGMVAPIVALAGIWALPGAEFLKEALEALVKAVWGTTQNFDADMRRAVGGGFIGEAFSAGLPSTVGLASLSKRLALDPVPFNDIKSMEVFSLMGPSGSFIEKIGQFYNYMAQGDIANALVAFPLMPRAAGNIIKGVDIGLGSETIRSQRGNVLISPEQIAEIDSQNLVPVSVRQAIGLPSPAVMSLREALVRREELAKQNSVATTRFNDTAAGYLTDGLRAQREGDNDRAARAFQRLQQHIRSQVEANAEAANAGRLDAIININMTAIQRRAYEDLMGRTSPQLGLRGVPQNIRPRAQEELQLYNWRGIGAPSN